MTSFERVCRPGLAYGRELTLDLYLPEPRPEGSGPVPLVVYFHGGGWVQGGGGSPSSVYHALEITADGLACACVNYRLAPAHPAPAAIEDAKLAIRWLRANAAEFGLDPRRIAAMGNSAGGHLALMAALARPAAGLEGRGLGDVSSAVQACVDLCGIADVAALLVPPAERPWARAWIPQGADGGLELARRCSPAAHVHADAPPILMIHGDADASVPHSQSAGLQRALTEAGCDAELVTLPGEGHMLGVTGPVSAQKAVREARRNFLRRLGFTPPGEP